VVQTPRGLCNDGGRVAPTNLTSQNIQEFPAYDQRDVSDFSLKEQERLQGWKYDLVPRLNRPLVV